MIIDGHLDLAWNALTLQRNVSDTITNIRNSETPEQWHHEGTAMVSFPEMRLGNINIAYGTIFAQPYGESPTAQTGYNNPEEAYQIAIKQIEWYESMEQVGEINIIRTSADLDNSLTGNGTNLMLLMEGADPLRTVDDIDEFIDRGIRAIGPAWRKTRYTGGAGAPGPLTDDGRQLIKKMALKNIALDLSHLSDLAINEAIDIHHGVIFASHSNSRNITMRNTKIIPGEMSEKISERQVDDSIIEQIAKHNGTIGIVMYNPFIDATWNQQDNLLPLSSLLPHINRIKEIGGIETVSIGSDFDGGVGLEATPEEFNTIADLNKLSIILSENRFNQSEIDAIQSQNLIRLMRMILN